VGSRVGPAVRLLVGGDVGSCRDDETNLLGCIAKNNDNNALVPISLCKYILTFVREGVMGDTVGGEASNDSICIEAKGRQMHW